LHFNIKNILSSHGFGNKEAYENNIYINLYEALKKAIVKGVLNKGQQLPPSRVLAKDLSISRSTVIKAYDLLLIENYIKSIQGSGCFIASNEQIKSSSNPNYQEFQGNYPKISKKGKAFKSNIQLIKNKKEGIAFRPGLPPLDVFPVQQWKSLSNHFWKTVKSSQLSYTDSLGLKCLRENIANYLRMYRNIVCNAEQIIITSGSLHSLYLIGNALIDTGDAVVMENPTYTKAFNLFNSLKADIQSSDIDEEGIIINTITCKNPKIIYTTPSNQYPSGIKMSMNRREELLKWASNNSTLIIEDDYDHEFSNWEQPTPSIYSLDKQKRVIYLGTFNKLLHPSLRIGYMIAPDYLKDTITALYQQSSRFISTALQETLSAFIEKDYLNKHIRRVIEVSIERKEVFIKCFKSNFEQEITLDGNHTGLHIIATLNKSIDDNKFAYYLSQRGITAYPYSNYFIGNEKKKGLVLGYCSVNNKLIKENILKMREAHINYHKN
jgi:GntR family transcriptional regulator/MocR family aminotransferase